MNNLTLESEYLIKLIKNVINEEEISPAPEGMDWKSFIDLAKKQQVYSVIAEALEKLNIPKEQKQKLTLYSQNELLRMLAMKSEFEEIEQELNEKEIKYMLLKGSVLRQYYPKEKMRQMSDMDILYDNSKADTVSSFMKKRGYALVSSGDHSDDYMKKPFYTFEFHRDLFDEDSDFNPDFSFVWENAKKDELKEYKYNMNCNDLYLHTVTHMYKHYILGGFGIRFLCDVYLILKKDSSRLNFDYISRKLNKFGIKQFEEDIKELSIAVFENSKLTAMQIDFLANTMKFGVYGDSDYGVKLYFDDFAKEHQGEKHLLFKYYLKKTFPSADFMKKNYRVLQKHSYLLPLFYIVRIFEKVKYRRKYISNSYNVLKNTQKKTK